MSKDATEAACGAENAEAVTTTSCSRTISSATCTSALDKELAQVVFESKLTSISVGPAHQDDKEANKLNFTELPLSQKWNMVVESSEGEASVMSEEAVEEVNVSDATSVTSCDPDKAASVRRPNENSETGIEASTTIADLPEQRRLQQQQALKASKKEIIEPLKYLRKGAVAAVGGAMIGVGLIMIPLPTPFGAAVASSGLAVLGTEFESAKEMNDKIIGTTKIHFESARDRVIQSIESMEEEQERQDDSNTTTSPILEVETGSKEEEDGATDADSAPVFMNPAMRKRQEDLAKKKQVEQQKKAPLPNYYDMMKRRTTAYLARNLVPMLKKTIEPVSSKEQDLSETASVPDAEATVQSELETMSEIDQADDFVASEDMMGSDSELDVNSTDDSKITYETEETKTVEPPVEVDQVLATAAMV